MAMGPPTLGKPETVIGHPLDPCIVRVRATGDDSVVGNAGADQLFGDEGDDTVDSRDGVNGNDSLNGGPHINGDTALSDATENSIVGFP